MPPVLTPFGKRLAAATPPAPAAATHVFEGAPDVRQLADVAAPVNRFRPTYPALTADEKTLHDDLKSEAAELEATFERVKLGRYRSLAMTDLESAVMWAAKELTS